MDSKREYIAKSQNDKVVWVDTINSHAATHIADTPKLKELAAEVLSQTILSQDYHQLHKDLGRIVGTCDLIANQPGDEIVYAKRLNRNEYTVFNKTRPPQPSSLVTVAVEKRDDDTYELVSAWVGPSDSPSFPGTERETAESKEFWSNHSLAWGRQEVQPETLTTICPW
ncbi:MAG TPA: hypothetical protein VF733_05360 [Candidatus Saccharimonadales bacterium]